MKFRFCVIAFVPPEWQIGVVGEREEIGGWKVEKCLPLIPQEKPQTEFIPSFWYRDVDFFNVYEDADNSLKHETNERTKDIKTVVLNTINQADIRTLKQNIRDLKFEYKFIKWKVYDSIQDYNSANHESVYVSPLPLAFLKENKNVAKQNNLLHIFIAEPSQLLKTPNVQDINNIIWEGNGSIDNRKFNFDDKNLIKNEVKGKIKKIYIIPSVMFNEATTNNMHISEMNHTTRYYKKLKEIEDIHYNKIFENIFIGSCPRNIRHILLLKNKLKVTCVFNFQTEEDIRNNFICLEKDIMQFKSDNRTPEFLYELYEKLKLLYIWIPVKDMDTESRARMSPQASFILHGIISAGHVVYLHCNAGVGRSVCAVGAYLRCVAGFSLQETHFLIQSKRPVAFFDQTSIELAAKDFKNKFILPE